MLTRGTSIVTWWPPVTMGPSAPGSWSASDIACASSWRYYVSRGLTDAPRRSCARHSTWALLMDSSSSRLDFALDLPLAPPPLLPLGNVLLVHLLETDGKQVHTLVGCTLIRGVCQVTCACAGASAYVCAVACAGILATRTWWWGGRSGRA